jgi:putative transcriptional regulator
MTIRHHPGSESLMSCSAGSMPESFAAVMAAHIDVCPQCRKDLALMESIGEALFKNMSTSPMTREAPVMELRRAEADPESAVRAKKVSAGDMPVPLRPLAGDYLDDVAWKRLAPGLMHYQFSLSKTALGDLRLIKVAPGMALPEHGHGGSELTLVLRGSYSDKTGRYGVGDLADLDDSIEHQPIADAIEGCICLIASDHKIRFKSVFARLVQPFTGM